MAFVISRSCAEAIRASSCVSLSSLFSASSISLFSISFFISFFRYFFIRPCLISFVAMARMLRISTIIAVIVSTIP
ncbi:hypothetical protein F5888DRAFT_1695457 [Russula emetica]|nr:hypothetical protein F5888DRAFT_1695457 [Russula emetica]